MKKLLFVFMLFLCLNLSSCFDFKEIRKASFCFGIGVDYNEDEKSEKPKPEEQESKDQNSQDQKVQGEESKGEDSKDSESKGQDSKGSKPEEKKSKGKYSFTLEIQSIKGISSQGGEFEQSILDIQGDTFIEARANLSAVTTGVIDFKHCQVLIFNQDINVKDLTDLTYSFFDLAIISNNALTLISKEKTAKDILEVQAIAETSTSFEILASLNYRYTYFNYSFKNSLTNLYNDLHGESGDFFIPTIGVQEIDGKKTSSVKGVRLYNNFEYIKQLDDEDLRNTLFLTKAIVSLVVELDFEDMKISIPIDAFKRKIKISNDKNKFEVTYNIKLKATLSHLKIKQKEIKEKFKKVMKEQIEEAFQKNQKENIDTYLLKNILYKRKYKAYEKYKENLSIQDINFQVNLKIKFEDRGILK